MMDTQQKRAAGYKPSAFFVTAAALLPAILGLFASCSGNPPEIVEARSRLVLFDDRGKNLVYEYLNIAVRASDEDGADDLESLALIHDGGELYWQVTGDRWTKRQIRQESWIAADCLAAADFAPLLRGTYRLVLKDYAGQKAESVIRLTAPAAAGAEFPTLKNTVDGLELVSAKEEAVLMVKSAAGTLLGAFTLKKGRNSRESILSNAQVKNQAKALYLYQAGPADGTALVSGPYEASDFLFPR